VLVALLCGCGRASSTPTLSTATVERAIAASILTQRHVRAAVACPSRVPLETGVVFTCTAELGVGTYPVSVTELNQSGHIRYQNPAPLVILNIAKVQRAIAQSILSQRHLPATVSCPAEVLQRPGIVFVCTATIRGVRYPFEVTEADGRGDVRYRGR
jgi:hypothetical protein